MSTLLTPVQRFLLIGLLLTVALTFTTTALSQYAASPQTASGTSVGVFWRPTQGAPNGSEISNGWEGLKTLIEADSGLQVRNLILVRNAGLQGLSSGLDDALAKAVPGQPLEVTLAIAAHGGDGIFEIAPGVTAPYKDVFDSLFLRLDQARTSHPKVTINLLFASCLSGSAIDELKPYSAGRDFVINAISATQSDMVSIDANFLENLKRAVNVVNRLESRAELCANCTRFQRIAKIVDRHHLHSVYDYKRKNDERTNVTNRERRGRPRRSEIEPADVPVAWSNVFRLRSWSAEEIATAADPVLRTDRRLARSVIDQIRKSAARLGKDVLTEAMQSRVTPPSLGGVAFAIALSDHTRFATELNEAIEDFDGTNQSQRARKHLADVASLVEEGYLSGWRPAPSEMKSVLYLLFFHGSKEGSRLLNFVFDDLDRTNLSFANELAIIQSLSLKFTGSMQIAFYARSLNRLARSESELLNAIKKWINYVKANGGSLATNLVWLMVGAHHAGGPQIVDRILATVRTAASGDASSHSAMKSATLKIFSQMDTDFFEWRTPKISLEDFETLVKLSSRAGFLSPQDFIDLRLYMNKRFPETWKIRFDTALSETQNRSAPQAPTSPFSKRYPKTCGAVFSAT